MLDVLGATTYGFLDFYSLVFERRFMQSTVENPAENVLRNICFSRYHEPIYCRIRVFYMISRGQVDPVACLRLKLFIT